MESNELVKSSEPKMSTEAAETSATAAAAAESSNIPKVFLYRLNESLAVNMPYFITRSEVLDKVRHLKTYPDDVIIAAYPKTGSGWMQQILHNIYHVDQIDGVSEITIDKSVPIVEVAVKGLPPVLDGIETMERPRLLKSHLYYEFFENQVCVDGSRFIVMLRNPKDVLVSLYHFSRSLVLVPTGMLSWDDFFAFVVSKQMIYGDVFDHFLGWWSQRGRQNVMFVKYEDMKRDPGREIRRIVAFCGHCLPDDTVGEIVSHTAFDRMKNQVNFTWYKIFDQKVSPYFRKGIVGDWKNYFNHEQNNFVDEQYRKRCLPVGLTFDFEI